MQASRLQRDTTCSEYLFNTEHNRLLSVQAQKYNNEITYLSEQRKLLDAFRKQLDHQYKQINIVVSGIIQ